MNQKYFLQRFYVIFTKKCKMDATDHSFVCMRNRLHLIGLTHFIFSNSEKTILKETTHGFLWH